MRGSKVDAIFREISALDRNLRFRRKGRAVNAVLRGKLFSVAKHAHILGAYARKRAHGEGICLIIFAGRLRDRFAFRIQEFHIFVFREGNRIQTSLLFIHRSICLIVINRRNLGRPALEHADRALVHDLVLHFGRRRHISVIQRFRFDRFSVFDKENGIFDRFPLSDRLSADRNRQLLAVFIYLSVEKPAVKSLPCVRCFAFGEGKLCTLFDLFGIEGVFTVLKDDCHLFHDGFPLRDINDRAFDDNIFARGENLIFPLFCPTEQYVVIPLNVGKRKFVPVVNFNYLIFCISVFQRNLKCCRLTCRKQNKSEQNSQQCSCYLSHSSPRSIFLNNIANQCFLVKYMNQSIAFFQTKTNFML